MLEKMIPEPSKIGFKSILSSVDVDKVAKLVNVPSIRLQQILDGDVTPMNAELHKLTAAARAVRGEPKDDFDWKCVEHFYKLIRGQASQ